MSAAPAPMIRVEALEKQFPGGLRALRGIDLEIAAGERLMLLGPNGSGKSTLLRCLNLLERPTTGRVCIDGLDLMQASRPALRRCRRRIGVVFQRFNLVPGMSAFQNVLFGALGREGLLRSTSLLASNARRAEAMACLARVNLVDQAGQRADTLSGGQQQRVAIARMLMQSPEIVLADEPIASLDPKAGRDVMDLLWDIAGERGLTVICTMHHLELAREYGGRVVGLNLGRVVLDQAADDVAPETFDELYATVGAQAHD